VPDFDSGQLGMQKNRIYRFGPHKFGVLLQAVDEAVSAEASAQTTERLESVSSEALSEMATSRCLSYRKLQIFVIITSICSVHNLHFVAFNQFCLVGQVFCNHFEPFLKNICKMG
jgi:hypothetical protein